MSYFGEKLLYFLQHSWEKRGLDGLMLYKIQHLFDQEASLACYASTLTSALIQKISTSRLWSLFLRGLRFHLNHPAQPIRNNSHHASQNINILEAEGQHQIPMKLQQDGSFLRCAVSRTRTAVDNRHLTEERAFL